MGIGFAGSFLGGLAALLSPCAAMLLPSFFAYAFGDVKGRLVARTGAFYLGMLLTLVPMGLGAGALGALLITHRQSLAPGGGVVLILLGLVTALGIRIPMPGLRSSGGTSLLAVIAMGAVYGLAGACTGPLLGAVLTMVTALWRSAAGLFRSRHGCPAARVGLVVGRVRSRAFAAAARTPDWATAHHVVGLVERIVDSRDRGSLPGHRRHVGHWWAA